MHELKTSGNKAELYDRLSYVDPSTCPPREEVIARNPSQLEQQKDGDQMQRAIAASLTQHAAETSADAWIPVENRFKKRFATQNGEPESRMTYTKDLRLTDTYPDGNCLLYCLSLAMEQPVDDVRNSIISKMVTNRSEYLALHTHDPGEYDDFVAAYRDPTTDTYGELSAIQGFADAYCMRVIVVTTGSYKDDYVLSPVVARTKGTVVLALVNRHYRVGLPPHRRARDEPSKGYELFTPRWQPQEPQDVFIAGALGSGGQPDGSSAASEEGSDSGDADSGAGDEDEATNLNAKRKAADPGGSRKRSRE